jgi:hypothetical protein
VAVTVLQLSNPDETGEKDVLGLWQAPQRGDEGIAFASAEEDILIFQADLPANISRSHQILEQQSRRCPRPRELTVPPDAGGLHIKQHPERQRSELRYRYLCHAIN